MGRHTIGAGSGRRERITALVGVLALVAATFVVTLLPGAAPQAAASLRQSFTAAFNAQTNGAIAVIGNSQMSCPTSDTTCAAARAASPAVGANTTYVNNNYAMAFLDVDGDPSTTNSTTADLAVPAGSTVQYALLTWGARQQGAVGNTNPAAAKFKVPGDTAYRSVTGTTFSVTGLTNTPYYTYLDVTSVVRAAGNGTYSVADLTGNLGSDMYAGWSLTVVYSNPAFPLRDLRVYQGFADVSSGNPVDIPINGLLTPPSGAVNASVGFVAWEGDSGYQGDQASLVNGGTVSSLSDATRPQTNFFDSAISDLGTINTSRNPAYRNSLGVDIGRIDATGLIPNSATSTTLRVSSTQDVYYPTQITTQIDLYTPRFNPVSKTVTNLSGHNPAQVGDVLQYDLTFTNTGDDFADAVVVNDVLAANQTYQAGSLQVVSGTGAGAKTDGTGDDTGEYLAASRTVRFRVGTGANATTGGTLAPNATTALQFRVTVDRAASGTSVPNTPTLDYTARAINNRYTYSGNTVTTPVRALADLSISKTATANQAAGRNITYTLTVANAGPNTATNVVTTDPLPPGVGFVSATPPAGTTCSAVNGTVTCSTATLANGASVAIPVVVSVPPGAGTGAITNTASVTADTADDVTTNNAAAATTTVTRLADVSLTKDAPATAVPGQNLTYTLTATNSGPSTAEAVTVTDQLPTGLTFVPAGSSSACSLSGSTVTCTAGTLAPGGTATFTLIAAIGSNLPDGAALTNSATASTSTPESSSTNNTDTATTTLTARADVQVVKTIGTSPAVAGRQSVYTLVVRNNGPSDAQAVTLTDPVPAALAITGVSATSGSCSVAGQTVNCAFGAVAPNQPITVTVRGLLDPAATGTLTNTATAATTTTDPTPGNNSSTTTTPIAGSADLSLVKTSDPGTIVYGAPVTYSLTVTNSGPSVATGTVTSDPLPAGFTFASSPDGCTAVGATVSCSVGTLAVGATRTVTFTANTPASGDGATVNTATVSSAVGDPVTANNTASARADGTSRADLSAQKTTVTAVPESGGAIRYQVVVRNNGPSDATGVVLTDPMPAGITFSSGSSDTGATCTVAGGTVSCPIGALANGATATVTIDATVGANTRNTSTNTATVSSSTTDPSPGNNASSSTVQIRAVADLAVTLVPAQQNYLAGQVVDYVLTVTNTGPATSNGVVVTGQVPPGMIPILGSSGGACSVSGGTVTCALGNLPSGAVIRIPLQAQIDPQTPAGTITGSAAVGSTTFDPVAANNSSTADITVGTQADLSVDKSVSPSPLTPGSTGVYTVTVTNDGPSDAVNPVVTDTLTAALVPGTPTASLGSCTLTGQAVRCTADRLAAGQQLVVRIPVTVDPDATGSVTNAASATSDTDDPTPADNTAQITTPLAPAADLVLVKSADRSSLTAGSSVTYSLTLTNSGPSDAAGAAITDTLPAGMTVLPGGVSTQVGSCSVSSDSRTVQCDLGTLGAGRFAVVTVEALVDQSVADGASLANTATASSTTTDPDPTDNSSTLELPVAASANVSITKRSATDTVVAGGRGSYVLSVRNVGPSLARSVVVTDPLPDGLTLVAATTSTGSCSSSGNTVRCALGDLSAGENATVQIDVAVADDISGTSLTNRATAASSPTTGAPTPDPNTANNASTAAVPVVEVADLSLTKRRTSGPVIAGSTVGYLVTVANAGPSVSTSTTVLDPIPAGTTYVSSDPSDGGTCALTDGTLACVWPSTVVGGSHTVVVRVAVPTTAAIGTLLTNTATASGAGNDPTPAAASESGTITASADLSTVKQLISETPVAGGPVRWTITVSNAGPSIAAGSTVTDTIPDGVTLSGVPTSSQGSCTVTGGTAVSCALGSIAPDTQAVVTVTGTLDAGFTGDAITNSATAGSTTGDPTPGNDTGSVTSPVTSSADLSLTKTGAPAQLTAGSPISWTITASNATGPSTARDVVVRDPLPDGVTGVTATVPGGSCAISRGVVQCSIATIAFGSSAVVTVSGTVTSSYVGTSLDNTASVRSSTPDPDGSDNTAGSSNPVTTSADLAVDVSGPATAAPGASATWTVLVSNQGPSDSSGASVTITLPAALGGARVTGPGGACTVTGVTAVCPVGTLPDGQSTTITVTGTIDPGATGDLVVSAASSGGTPDPVSANNSDSATTTLAASADLVVSKSLVGAAVAGEPVEWVIGFRNDGPSTARGVVVTDPVPAGVQAVSATLDGTPCTVAAATITCTVGDLPPDAPDQILVRGVLAADVTGSTLVNTASISSTTADPVTGNNSATSSSPVRRSADLVVGKRITSGTPVAGAPITFEVTVRNDGPSVATGVTVTDTVPDVVTGLTASADQGSCSVTDQDVSCDAGTLTVGQVVTVTVSGTLTQAFGQNIGNTATATSADIDDPVTANNSSTAVGGVDDVADISVTKTGPASVDAGAPIRWTVTVANSGPSDARDVRLTDVVPASVTGVTLTPDNGAVCADPANCVLGTVPANGQVAVVVTGTVAPGTTASSVRNVAVVTTASNDPDGTNNTAAAVTAVTRSTALSVSKTVTPDPVVPGSTATYRIVVSNTGPSNSPATLSDALPDGVTVVDPGPTSSAGSCTLDTRALACDLGTITAGSSVAVTVPVVLDAAYTGTALVNTATASTPYGQDATGTSTAPATPQADLTISKTGPATVRAGDPVAWNVTVSNSGPSVARAVTFTDTLPAGVIDPVVTSSAGDCTVTGAEISCALGDVAVGDPATVTVSITATVDPSFTGTTLENTGTIASATPEPPDPNSPEGPGGPPADPGRTDTATTAVSRVADVQVFKAATTPATAPGSPIGWTVTVRNNGPSTATGVSVVDALPDGLQDVVFTPPAGTTCTATGDCTIGTLLPGADQQVEIGVTATVDPAFTGTSIRNAATSPASTVDPVPGNNTDEATVSLVPSADLAISKAADPAVAGGAVGWTVSVVNGGPSVARDVVITDPLPAGVTGIRVAAPTGVDCTAADGTVTCRLAALAPGADNRVTIRIEGTLSPDATGDLSNTATVASTTPDANTDDNTATATVPIGVTAGVSVTKTGPATVPAGGRISWTVTVRGGGPATARGVVLDDPAPAGLDDVAWVPSQGSCTDLGSCALGDLAPGVTATVTVTATVPADYAGATVSNTATATSTTTDPDPSDNSATARSTVDKRSDLVVTKTAEQGTVTAGQQVTWRLRVTNRGPAADPDVVVIDKLPRGLTAVEPLPDGCTAVASEVRCSLGTVAVGEVVDREIVTLVSDQLEGTVVNGAVVDGAHTDPLPDSNDDGGSIVVEPPTGPTGPTGPPAPPTAPTTGTSPTGSPTPTGTAGPTTTAPAPTPPTTGPGGPGGELPNTGVPVQGILWWALGLLLAGAAALLIGRRRRV